MSTRCLPASFGCLGVCLLRGPAGLCLGFGLVLGRADHHDHVAAVDPRVDSIDTDLCHVLGKLLQQADAHFRTLLLAAAELDHGLDLVTGREEPQRVPAFGLVVVLVDLQPEPDFLEHSVGLVLARLACLDRSLVLVLAEVHQLAHRRLCLRRDLNQVKFRFRGQAQGILNADNADLFTVRSD